jgi:ferredoxin
MITINQADCKGCGTCVETCPNEAIQLVDGRAQIDRELCEECGACLDVCPYEAIRRDEIVVAPPREVTPAPPREVMPAPQQPSPLAAVGTALIHAGLEALPHVLDFLAERAESRADRAQPRTESRARESTDRDRQRTRRSYGAGSGGACVCPACGYRTGHRAGMPCRTLTCPRCGDRMRRA